MQELFYLRLVESEKSLRSLLEHSEKYLGTIFLFSNFILTSLGQKHVKLCITYGVLLPWVSQKNLRNVLV